jgi:hypothetical protein
MTTTVEDFAADVLERGLDDWVYLAEVDYAIRDRLRGEPPEVIKSQCLAVLEYLLANKLAEVGDLRDVGGEVRFVPWDMDPGASLNEAERRWSRFGGPRDESGANDVCWLSNTEGGDELARGGASSSR